MATGNIILSFIGAGEELAEKISPFDTYIQLIDGITEVTINHNKMNLLLGEGTIIPA